MPKTDAEQREFLASLGLNDKTPARPEPVLDVLDTHTMPVTDIVFDPAMLDGFPDLSGGNFAAASRHLFEIYKSPGRNKDRNSLLHRRIGEFVSLVRTQRKTGGIVQEKVKTTAEQRDLAQLIAAAGITAADLAALIKEKP